MANNTIDTKALHKIGYGLYVITSNDGERDNGMICNTVVQLSSDPLRIGVSINKSNYSHEIIKKTGRMNVNCLNESAPFSVFEAFGFKSGRDTDKFKDCTPKRSANGLAVLPHYINAYMSLEVVEYVDLGSHGLFICDLTDSVVIYHCLQLVFRANQYHCLFPSCNTCIQQISRCQQIGRAHV